MSILKYFKNIPRSPYHRATGPKCNFFSSNLQRGHWEKKGPVFKCTSSTIDKPLERNFGSICKWLQRGSWFLRRRLGVQALEQS